MVKEFVVTGDGHTQEPMDLFTERLPKDMRDRAFTQTEFELEEPLVPGGHTVFRTMHAPGYEGWTVSRFRQHTGPTPDWMPEGILTDLDRDGVDAAVLFPNFALFPMYTDDHEYSMAHARVYNDWLAETYASYAHRLRPAAAIPTTDIADAVAEVERAVSLGLHALVLPEHPQPLPYHADEYEPLWAAAEANGLPIFFHVASGGVDTKADKSATGDQVKGILTAMSMGKNKELDKATLSARSMGGGNTSAGSPMRIIADLVSSGACERHPDLIFNMIEFNAGWLANYMHMMDKAWRTGTGQDPNWWLGYWQEGKPMEEQDLFGQLFTINDRWPHPLKPSEYIKRNIRVQFADDRMAVLARHITGIETIYWGNDYPHAEGTWLGSQALFAEQFEGVPEDERAMLVGGTLAKIVGFDTSTKFAPVEPHPDALPIHANA